ncbi:nanoRNase/pAp phosphatase, hydrolyzes c-di-AMP and oligoRNAs [Halopenitus malekzadehii]|uniref:NanoRNase/pAp phosphatase, hydrolyzes c-di-AMP and oligoRNAs n=1 Tax=Halopenitus malekzadehii TaxID=1267564 RepID=A0A1H6I203_9EURY|nr:bifunctional oligoribonuclease/PAP phosphatase NrnA [Halopenitus malekzadehii]SEH40500.1 nanoRNase/pAp phosphatase, hydrolyzes c-di-AMP and oligoRNAs [Halopenitus malekzadehii]
MVRRLVLGCSGVGHTLIEHARQRRGDVYVITDDTGWVTTLRESNVPATEADPADATAYPERADVVVCAADDVDRNLAAARTARRAYPAATLIAYVGGEADAATRESIAATVDRCIDPVSSLTQRVLEAVDADADERIVSLVETVRSLSGPLAVVTHDNPDPDAIAAAIGLTRVADAVGVDADACYGGEISHQENRALVNLLDIRLRHLESVALADYGGVALVDHSRPGINDSLPTDTDVDIVIDHHPPRGPVEARYIDVRPDLGATSTQIAQYLDRLGIEPDERIATALLYGIRIDTRDFTREVAIADIEAAAAILGAANVETLERVETPTVSPETFETLARAIRERELEGSVVASCVGEIADRDTLAQAAERLLDMEGVTVTFVYGFLDDTIYASARARGADVDLGETLRDALGQIGSAGGHADMAGAQIPLGILGAVEGDSTDSLVDVVRESISGRFFETIADAPTPPTADVDLARVPAPADEGGEHGDSDAETAVVGDGSEDGADEDANVDGGNSDVDGENSDADSE